MATKSDSARMLLASHGIEFAALDWPKVSQYLEKLKPGRWLTEARLTGWTDHSFKTFVLPHKTLGNDAETYFDVGKENGEYGVSGQPGPQRRHRKAGNAVSQPLAGVIDPKNPNEARRTGR